MNSFVAIVAFFMPQNAGLPKTCCTGVPVVEMLFRLGLALILSLSLALLLAWGWDRSEPPLAGTTALAPAPDAATALQPAR